jgi:hypothetical protein
MAMLDRVATVILNAVLAALRITVYFSLCGKYMFCGNNKIFRFFIFFLLQGNGLNIY